MNIAVTIVKPQLSTPPVTSTVLPGDCSGIGKYDILWRKPTVKQLYIGDQSNVFKISIKNPLYQNWPNYNHIDIRSKTYIGFIVLFREHCGKKLLKSMSDGKNIWEKYIMDLASNQYSIQHSTIGKGNSRMTMQYRLNNIVEHNAPLLHKTKIKNLRRDDIQLVMRLLNPNQERYYYTILSTTQILLFKLIVAFKCTLIPVNR